MDFDPPEAVRPLLDRIEKFVADVVIPAEPSVLERGFAASRAAARTSCARRCKAAKLWGPQLPNELGGLGLGLVEHGLVSERLGRSPLGHYVFGCQAPDAGNIEILHKYGTPEQKAKWLEPLAHGEIRSCFSMTEPENPGSNPTMLSCRAVRDGDDYVIDGHKWFTSVGRRRRVRDRDGGDQPRRVAARARVDDHRADRHAGLRAASRNIKIMGDAGAGYGEPRRDLVPRRARAGRPTGSAPRAPAS